MLESRERGDDLLGRGVRITSDFTLSGYIGQFMFAVLRLTLMERMVFNALPILSKAMFRSLP